MSNGDDDDIVDFKPLFSVMATVPNGGASGGIFCGRSWSDRELAGGRKLTAIGIKESGNGRNIAGIRAR